ncbi:hypothetical protein [Aquibium carbonis]|uniref:hypothetical protein n=1 Tax=Aquibium carbonis TaxID=2495581 RepID=UPI003CCB27EA
MAPSGAAVFRRAAPALTWAAAELVERLLQGDVAVEIVGPVARGAADPLALDEAFQPPSHGKPRLADQGQCGLDVLARRQEEGGADRRLADGERLRRDMGARLLR